MTITHPFVSATLVAAVLAALVPAVVCAQPTAPGDDAIGPLARAGRREAARYAVLEHGTKNPGTVDSKRPGWIVRHTVLFPTLVGAAAGSVWGGFLAGPYGNPQTGGNSTRTEGFGVGAALGAGVGALTGAIIETVRQRPRARSTVALPAFPSRRAREKR